MIKNTVHTDISSIAGFASSVVVIPLRQHLKLNKSKHGENVGVIYIYAFIYVYVYIYRYKGN